MGQTTGCVATVERALRAAQNFNPLEIEQLKAGARHLAQVDVVDVNRNRAFLVGDEIILRHTTNANGKVRWAVGLDGADAGREASDFLGTAVTELLDLFAGIGRHCDADVLYALFALLRGDNDFLKHLGVGRHGGQGRNGCGERGPLKSSHGVTPMQKPGLFRLAPSPG